MNNYQLLIIMSGYFIIIVVSHKIIQLIKEKDEIIKKQDEISKKQDVIIKEQDVIIKEQDAIIKEQHIISKEQDVIIKNQNEISKEHDVIIEEKKVIMKGKDKIIVRKKLLVEDPHFGELLAINAQHELEHEIWRSEESKRIYASLTSSSCIELINASCWVAYADPFSKKRSCFEYNSTIDTSLLRNIWNRLQELFSNNYKWSDETRKNFLSVYAFHTTGIEGNILTLPQTKLVINNINLFPGFKDDTFATPLTLKRYIK